jgi:hypothetical protein
MIMLVIIEIIKIMITTKIINIIILIEIVMIIRTAYNRVMRQAACSGTSIVLSFTIVNSDVVELL